MPHELNFAYIYFVDDEEIDVLAVQAFSWLNENLECIVLHFRNGHLHNIKYIKYVRNHDINEVWKVCCK
jgi:hypothetical protein